MGRVAEGGGRVLKGRRHRWSNGDVGCREGTGCRAPVGAGGVSWRWTGHRCWCWALAVREVETRCRAG